MLTSVGALNGVRSGKKTAGSCPLLARSRESRLLVTMVGHEVLGDESSNGEPCLQCSMVSAFLAFLDFHGTLALTNSRPTDDLKRPTVSAVPGMTCAYGIVFSTILLKYNGV